MVSENNNMLSEYERKRMEQIQENNAKLFDLGIQPRVAPVTKKAKVQKTKTIEKTRSSKRIEGIQKLAEAQRIEDLKIKAETQRIADLKRAEAQRIADVQRAEKLQKIAEAKKAAELERMAHAVRKTTLYKFRSNNSNHKIKESLAEESYSEEEDEDYYVESEFPKWEGGNIFGSIPGIPVGSTWVFREELYHCGIHRLAKNMHGSKDTGCFSIALVRGCQDVADEGETFTFTHSFKTKSPGIKQSSNSPRNTQQSSNQGFDEKDLPLKISLETGKPIRVIRGNRLESPYAPEKGYRYDGLYKAIKTWREKGSAGHMVCLFKLQRLPDQPPLIAKPVIEEEDIKME